MGWVTMETCVNLYTTAEEIGAEALKEYCSRLISIHWVSLHITASEIAPILVY